MLDRDPFRRLDSGESLPFSMAMASLPRPKRSSFTNFFAFSSKKRSSQVPQPNLLVVPSKSVAGKWFSDGAQKRAQLANPTAIPSPLRTESEEYYYSYYSPVTQDSQLSSPVDGHPSHTLLRHPYAYSMPLAGPSSPPLRHVSSQPLQHLPPDTLPRLPSQQHGHDLARAELKTSVSTPNLATGSTPARHRSFLRRRTRSKGQDRWFSPETWWDALFSPSPRFKVKQTPRTQPPPDRTVPDPVPKPPPIEPSRTLGVTFPSVQPTRPRAVSVNSAASSARHPLASLTRSRSAFELNGQPSTSASANPRTAFEPALETLADEPTPPPDRPSISHSDLALPDPPLSLAQVLNEVEAFEQQRAQWKHQATTSLGNKHTRSLSRARTKSLGERHVRLARHPSEASKTQMNLELLAARTLLGSQSMRPVVHVTKPSNNSSHSKAHSYSHSQSAHSHSHSSHSRAYSHSHSHSLTTSHSSKSSRHLPPRGHSRAGSWSKTAFLKAGSLCGLGQDDSHVAPADERIPSSSRVQVQGVNHVGGFASPERVSDADKVSTREVGIAISSSPPPDPRASPSRHQEADRESRWSSKYTYKSSEYAGPHPSAIDTNIPQLSVASDVSLRHRLPPRAAIQPPISPIAHPYGSATAQSNPVGDKSAAPKVTEGRAVEPDTGCVPGPHLSLSHADFERYGVGEALVYASSSRLEDVQCEPSPTVESPVVPEPSSACDTIEGRDTSSSPMDSIPSLTQSTIQMVMSAFDNPDDLDEFQDLFYKPHRREPSATISQVPTDVHSSTPSSPLSYLVRKLSEEVKSFRHPSRTPSDPIPVQRSDSQDESSGTKFMYMDVVQRSTSPKPMDSSSQLQVTIQDGNDCCGAQRVMVVPEDVQSSYALSVLESPLDHENDTFGYPIKHGQLEAVTSPTPVQSPVRVSTHLSIQDSDEPEEDDAAFLSPVTKRFGLTTFDAVRASYLTTTSDVSRMSGLSDFPLPPGVRPLSILQAYFEAPLSPLSQTHGHSDDEAGHAGDGDADVEQQPGDVGETLRALRMTPRVTSYESRRSTFGGSETDDAEFITRLHQAAS